MYLENLTPIETFITHGDLGIKGNMGYQIIPSVNGQSFNHIISAHASSIIKYKLDKKYRSFHSYIGLNDSSSKNHTNVHSIPVLIPQHLSTANLSFDSDEFQNYMERWEENMKQVLENELNDVIELRNRCLS